MVLKIHVMAEAYGRRPSDFFNIEDEYAAWCFDEAVHRWGSFVQGELAKVDGKNRQQIEGRQERVLRRLLKGFSMPPGLPIKKEEVSSDS